MKKILRVLILFSFPVHAQFINISIDNGATATFMFPSEPTVTVNPLDPSQLVVGANLDRVYYSFDAGFSWVYDTLASTYGVYGDPCIVIDTQGNFYYTHLSATGTQIICQKSVDGGVTWSNGTLPAFIPNIWADKEWASVDWSGSPWSNSIYLTWTELADSLRILFSKSTDLGLTWSAPLRISKGTVNLNPWPEGNIGAVSTVGLNGEIYAVWSGRSIRFNKSLDGGTTWMSDAAYIDTIIPEWRYDSIMGVNREQALPAIACDHSGGAYTGNLYVCWADQRNGTSNTDVFMSASSNGGSTWNTIRVNTDLTTSHQFMPWLTVDQVTGYIYVVYYDRSNYTDMTTDVYLSWSTDGGASFNVTRINTLSFYPPNMYGDYIGIAAYDNSIHPVWTQEDNFGHSVWSALVDYAQLDTILAVPIRTTKEEFILKQNYPNPFSERTYSDFFIPRADTINLSVFDITGNRVAIILNQENLDAGWHHAEINATELKLSSGIYYLKLEAIRFSATKKIIVAR